MIAFQDIGKEENKYTPLEAASSEKEVMRRGVRCAEVMVTWKGISRSLSRLRPGLRTGRSESEPIVTAINGLPEEVGNVIDVGAEEDVVSAFKPLRSARMDSVNDIKGPIISSASGIELPTNVI